MNEAQFFTSNRDALLLAIPFLFVLFLTAFRLDHLIAKPKSAANTRRPKCGIDDSGEPILCDPDGTVAGVRSPAKALQRTMRRVRFVEAPAEEL